MNRKRFSKEVKLAYHEAGHAVAAYILRRSFKKVTIVKEGNTLGHVSFSPLESFESNFVTSYRKNTFKKQIIISFAGYVAELKLTGQKSKKMEKSADFEDATSYAERLFGPEEEVKAYLNFMWVRAKNLFIFDNRWNMVKALAEELLIRKTIGCQKARKIIEASKENF